MGGWMDSPQITFFFFFLPEKNFTSTHLAGFIISVNTKVSWFVPKPGFDGFFFFTQISTKSVNFNLHGNLWAAVEHKPVCQISWLDEFACVKERIDGPFLPSQLQPSATQFSISFIRRTSRPSAISSEIALSGIDNNERAIYFS